MLLLCALLVLVSGDLVSGALASSANLVLNARDSRRYADCHEARKVGGYVRNGTYEIFLVNATKPAHVVCLHGTEFSGTVIQSRYTGSVPFERVWKDYKVGFGSLHTDFWLGLDHIHLLTYQGNTQLTITMRDVAGVTQTMLYKYFHVDTEANLYRLSIANAFGYLPDDMSHQNGMPFATLDRPDVNKCAHNMRAGWWYNYCAYALLNGHHYPGGTYTPSGGMYDGIFWKDWHGFGYSLPYVSMVVSPPTAA